MRLRTAGAGLLATIAVAAALAACTQQGPDRTVDATRAPTPDSTPEAPRDVAVEVVERGSGDPVAGALLEAGEARVLTDAGGRATLNAMRGTRISITAADHDPAGAVVPANGSLRVELRSTLLTGTVTDEAGTPLADVRVFVDGSDALVRTDDRGRYELRGVPEAGTVIFKRAGHRLGEVPIGDEPTMDVALPRFDVRALYAPAGIFQEPGRLDEMLGLIEATEVNALVIDVKETDGRLYYATDLAAAVEIGAVRETPILELEELLPMLHERGIYAIARVVVMKDDTLVAARPEMAVRNLATGGPWRDNLGDAWLDPAAPGVAEYVAAIASDLAEKGFDEVQLDYIRFYSDGPLGSADTILPNTQAFRLPAVQRVLRVVSDALSTTRAFLGADVFPISFILASDQGIGQRPEVVMPFVDYACPMAYPSHYGPGLFGFEVPNEHPYAVVEQTLEIMAEQAAEWPVALRPWIQDFGYGPFPPYTAEQVRAEIDAAEAGDARGWMIWHWQATYTVAALGPPRDGEDAGSVSAAGPISSASP